MLEIKSPHNQEKMGLTLLIIISIVVTDLPVTVHTFIQSQTHHKLRTKTGIYTQSGFANFIDEWSQCDFCFTNFGVILEYLESSITTKKAIFRLSSKWPWHVYIIVRDTRSSCCGPLTWRAQIHDVGHRVNFDRNLPSSCFVVQYNSLISII